MRNFELYKALMAHQFDGSYSPDPGYRFEEKIAKANNWDLEFTISVIEEYRRFMYLYIVNGRVAPSDIIDQVWHQHILYTRDYEKFCNKFAGKFLHHSPDRHIAASMSSYEAMMAAYEEEFDHPAGPLWQLEGGDFKRVDLSRNYLIPNDNTASAIKAAFLTLGNYIREKRTKLFS